MYEKIIPELEGFFDDFKIEKFDGFSIPKLLGQTNATLHLDRELWLD
jgi:hypothetical protein